MDFSKMTFDNTLNAMLLLQDQSRRIASGVLEKSSWLPQNEKKAINDWIESYKKGLEGLKSASDESYKIISHYFTSEEETINKVRVTFPP
jgi:hypothetical protein